MSSKSKRYCSVPQCRNYVSETISIFSFPKDEKLKLIWKEVLRIGKPISKCMSVCSSHFCVTDFTYMSRDKKRKRLKKGAVPSQNLPVKY